MCAVPDSVIPVIKQSNSAGRRLLLGFALLSVLMLVFSLVNINGLQRIGDQVATESELARARSVATRKLEASAANYMLGVKAAQSVESGEQGFDMAAHADEFERYLRAYIDLADTPQRRQLAETI